MTGLLAVTSASAHEKWFVKTAPPALEVGGFFSAYALSAAGVAAAVTLVAAWFWRKRNHLELIPGPGRLGATDDGLARFYGWVPVVLGVHFAVPLLILGVQ